ncbi:alpha/beta fold hydrolase [Crocinitomix sp.]|nr:alpha/beta fold hydrolase [Crocinitomix sp.]
MKIKLILSILLVSILKLTIGQNQDSVQLKSTEFTQAYLNKKNDIAITYFSAETIQAAHLSTALLAKIWDQLEGQNGKYSHKDPQIMGEEDGIMITKQILYFENNSLVLKLAFNGNHEIIGIRFLPNEAAQLELFKDDKIWEEEIKVKTNKDISLRGIITYPYEDKQYPAVVLVHGSGPNDMDETYGPNKLFKELAHQLAAKGVVVLRYEKRTAAYGGQPELDIETLTLAEETIDDALAAVDLLKKNTRVDKSKIIVLGHSLGGMSAPQIALEGKKSVAGMIIMAGNARPLQDIVLEQYTYLSMKDGEINEEEAALIQNYELELEALNELKVKGVTKSPLPFGLPAAYWNYLLKYNQIDIAKTIQQPILILQGERDYQVTPKELEIWKSNLANKTNVTYKKYVKLNHFMKEGEGKSYPSEYMKALPLPSYLVDDIVNWIKAIK